MAGRLDRFPGFPDGLSGSSMREWYQDLKKALVGGAVADYGSAAAALAGMKSDGGAPSRAFTVGGDMAMWVADAALSKAVRIGPGDLIAAGMVTFTWSGSGATPAWSPEVDINFGGALDGRVPDAVLLTPLVQGGGVQRVSPYVVTDGTAVTPDVTAVRARVRCAMEPAPTSEATRACFWIAIALEA